MEREDPTRRWRRRNYREPVPEGSTDLDLRVGSLVVRLLALPTTWTPWVDEQLAPFAAEPGGWGTPDLIMSCREERGPVVPLPGPGESTLLEIARPSAERLVVRSHWQDGDVDLAAGRGELVICARAWDLFTMSVENALRVVAQALSLERGAFLLHAAGIVRHDGRAVLLAARSGTGKSTATMLAAPRVPLSDDLVLVEQPSAAPRVAPLPFYPAAAPGERIADPRPIAGVLLLEQSSSTQLAPLSRALAVARLTACIPFVRDLGEDTTRLHALVDALAASVPVHVLRFTKDADVGALIDQV
jgi:hypothetical protein